MSRAEYQAARRKLTDIYLRCAPNKKLRAANLRFRSFSRKVHQGDGTPLAATTANNSDCTLHGERNALNIQAISKLFNAPLTSLARPSVRRSLITIAYRIKTSIRGNKKYSGKNHFLFPHLLNNWSFEMQSKKRGRMNQCGHYLHIV